MFVKELQQAGHTRRFSIKKKGETGWEVRDVQDDRVLKQVCYTDWHRVERAAQMFNILIDDLESLGWVSPTPTR
ncbi:MAG TPA: hypothetical protein VL225_20175 [Vicinamibacterales bacterium]|jgi:hypothetical protein|nr:hypothetical protein [Vicinamibacterales bacterium]